MEITKEQELLGAVISKAWEDALFKEFLIKDPVAAIEQLTGKTIQLPEGKTIIVRDQTDESTIYINIPAQRSLDDAELSEEQLEAVSGGKLDATIWPIFRPDLPIIIVEPLPILPITGPVLK